MFFRDIFLSRFWTEWLCRFEAEDILRPCSEGVNELIPSRNDENSFSDSWTWRLKLSCIHEKDKVVVVTCASL